MRTKYDTASAQESYRRTCSFCRNDFYISLIRECPEREGRTVCAYCCKLCRQHYLDGGMQGCRAADAVRSKKERGAA